MTIRGRGRPTGTSPHRASDDLILKQCAHLLLTGRAPNPTEAFRRVTKPEDDAAVRRLQRRWQREGQSFLDACMDGLPTSRKALEERNLAETAPELLEHLRRFETSPGGIELLAGLAQTPAARITHDILTLWRLREQHVAVGSSRADEEFEKAWAQWIRFGTPPDEAFLRRFSELCLEHADLAAKAGPAKPKVPQKGKAARSSTRSPKGDAR